MTLAVDSSCPIDRYAFARYLHAFLLSLSTPLFYTPNFHIYSAMAQNDHPHLVVVGSGWVGLYIAQYINTSIYSVSVVSPRRTSAYTPLLASAACGLFPFSYAEESLRAKGRRCNFIKATVVGVDFATKQVHCESAFDDDSAFARRLFDLPYDYLILCPGCT